MGCLNNIGDGVPELKTSRKLWKSATMKDDY